MKFPKVVKFEEGVKNHKKYIAEGHIYSEQWGVKYDEFDGEFWRRKELIYCTEWKGMVEDVKQQFYKDFVNKKVELVSITYH